jgi:predicted DCC family thiol-disulfide oxidoreductase YuxK
MEAHMDTQAWLSDVEAAASERFARARSPRSLTILFDPGCVLCQKCCNWMLGQPSYVELRFVPCDGSEARARYGDLPWLADELIVVGDGGEVWVGPAAFLTCLWALEAWREWSYRLAGPAFAPLVERFFLGLSSRRRPLSALLSAGLGSSHSGDCEEGTCSLGR